MTIFRACRPVYSYCILTISYCTFCVGKHTILGPAVSCWIHFSSNYDFSCRL